MKLTGLSSSNNTKHLELSTINSSTSFIQEIFAYSLSFLSGSGFTKSSSATFSFSSNAA